MKTLRSIVYLLIIKWVINNRHHRRRWRFGFLRLLRSVQIRGHLWSRQVGRQFEKTWRGLRIEIQTLRTLGGSCQEFQEVPLRCWCCRSRKGGGRKGRTGRGREESDELVKGARFHLWFWLSCSFFEILFFFLHWGCRELKIVKLTFLK